MVGSPPRRRILLVTTMLCWGGAERQLEHLAIGLARAGHSVVLLVISVREADLEPFEAAGVRVVTLGAVGRLAKLRAVATIRRHARAADVVHCTGWDGTLWGRLGAFLARRPVVITEHTPGREAQAAAMDGVAGVGAIAWHNRVLDRVTYATIAVGAWQRQLLEGEGVRGDSIVHIPNGVPIDELRRSAAAGPGRAELGLPEEALVLIEVARFAPQKGQSTAVRTVRRLRERLGDVRIAFVGGGEYEETVRAEAADLGEAAIFLGFREDVPALLSLSDLSVLPSDGEGLPMSLIESIAVGTAIVATDVGDVGWFLEVTGAGSCVAAGDEEAFFEACEELLADPERRARLSAAGERTAPRFDAATMVRRYEEVFEAAIAAAPLPLSLEA